MIGREVIVTCGYQSVVYLCVRIDVSCSPLYMVVPTAVADISPVFAPIHHLRLYHSGPDAIKTDTENQAGIPFS